MLDKIQQGWRSPGWVNYLVLPVTTLYATLVFVRRRLFKSKLLKTHSLPVPVIVVGGLSAGGSGKTPVVIGLVNYLRDKGFNPGVISRGYGGNSAFWPREVDDKTDAETVGDEPQLMFERLGVPVVVGPDRVRDGHYLVDKCGCDIIVSDDGFQHFKLKRDVDIVVVDICSDLRNFHHKTIST